MRNVSIKRYAIIACLAAISYLLMFISFAVIPIVPYMKVDFADIPILLGFFVLGVSGGIEIAVLRSVLYFLITGPSIASLIGVGTNLLATLTIYLPMYYILHEKHDLKRYIIAIVVSTISLTFWLSIGNWLVITPLYMAVLGMKLTLPLSQLVLYGVLPFNLIKGVIVGTVFVLVYAKIHVWLDNKANEFLAETKTKSI